MASEFAAELDELLNLLGVPKLILPSWFHSRVLKWLRIFIWLLFVPTASNVTSSKLGNKSRLGSPLHYQPLNLFKLGVVLVSNQLEQNWLACGYHCSRMSEPLKQQNGLLIKSFITVDFYNQYICTLACMTNILCVLICTLFILTSKAKMRSIWLLDEVASATTCTSIPFFIKSMAVCCTHTWACKKQWNKSNCKRSCFNI